MPRKGENIYKRKDGRWIPCISRIRRLFSQSKILYEIQEHFVLNSDIKKGNGSFNLRNYCFLFLHFLFITTNI